MHSILWIKVKHFVTEFGVKGRRKIVVKKHWKAFYDEFRISLLKQHHLKNTVNLNIAVEQDDLISLLTIPNQTPKAENL